MTDPADGQMESERDNAGRSRTEFMSEQRFPVDAIASAVIEKLYKLPAEFFDATIDTNNERYMSGLAKRSSDRIMWEFVKNGDTLIINLYMGPYLMFTLPFQKGGPALLPA